MYPPPGTNLGFRPPQAPQSGFINIAQQGQGNVGFLPQQPQVINLQQGSMGMGGMGGMGGNMGNMGMRPNMGGMGGMGGNMGGNMGMGGMGGNMGGNMGMGGMGGNKGGFRGFNRWANNGINYQGMNGFTNVDYSNGWNPNVHDQLLRNNIDFVFQVYDHDMSGQL